MWRTFAVSVTLMCLIGVAGSGFVTAASAAESGNVNFEDPAAKASYAVGLDIASGLLSQGWELDYDAMMQGMIDAKAEEGKLDKREAKQAMKDYSQLLQQARFEELLAQGEANKKEGQEFLKQNADKDGVKVTDSGLQYKVLEKGDGPVPTREDVVTVHYRGKLINGEEFDSSFGRGQPSTFPVNGVVEGWQEALTMMPKGAKWEVYLPSELAYGEQARPPMIGPNSVLIFEIELLEVQDKAAFEQQNPQQGGQAQ